MSNTQLEKELELDKSRKKFFDDSKFQHDNQKYGLFSFPGTLAISSKPYFAELKASKNDDGTVKIGPRNFLVNKPRRGKTPDSYFSYPEYTAEKYTGQKLPFKSDKERADAMRTKHDQNWKPSGPPSENYSLYPHEASESFKTIKRKLPDGTVRVDPRNFYTSPGKKGSNTPGIFLGGYPEHMPDPFERKGKKEKMTRGVSHDAPFRNMDRGGGTFNKDMDIYGPTETKMSSSIKRSITPRVVKHDLPFRPSNPSQGFIGKYPEYMANPQPVVKRKGPSEREPWKHSTSYRSTPSPSVTNNYKNLRSEYPSLKRMV